VEKPLSAGLVTSKVLPWDNGGEVGDSRVGVGAAIVWVGNTAVFVGSASVGVGLGAQAASINGIRQYESRTNLKSRFRCI